MVLVTVDSKIYIVGFSHKKLFRLPTAETQWRGEVRCLVAHLCFAIPIYACLYSISSFALYGRIPWMMFEAVTSLQLVVKVCGLVWNNTERTLLSSLLPFRVQRISEIALKCVSVSQPAVCRLKVPAT